MDIGKKYIAVIGATGSVGMQALDVIERNSEYFDVRLLTAHSNRKLLNELGRRVNASQTVLTEDGMQELLSVLDDIQLDLVLIAALGTEISIVAYKLAQRGVNIALANKECIVAAGKLLLATAKESGSKIIPVDSEHSALLQCMQGHNKDEISQVILTASGGAFRDMPKEAMLKATVEEALRHPNWKMGKKITVDSASMMNKGLELIEARILFDIEPFRMTTVIHPQSIIHSMVAYKDGSIIAQMGEPDMRIPISYGLFYPNRGLSGVKALDFTQQLSLNWHPPDLDKYQCLRLAIDVLNNDKTAEIITMNAANEVAVNAFLHSEISFGDIALVIEDALTKTSQSEPKSIEDVLTLDHEVKEKSKEFIGMLSARRMRAR